MSELTSQPSKKVIPRPPEPTAYEPPTFLWEEPYTPEVALQATGCKHFTGQSAECDASPCD